MIKVLISFICIISSLIVVSEGLSCTEEPVCSTFPKEALQVYCSSFLKVPCPVSCGKCAAEKLKMKFSAAFDSNADGKITLEEAQSALKTLGISLEDALVTEIKDIIFDSKLAILDLYTALDLNKDMIVTINELFHGLLNSTESIGVTLKPEMKQTLLNIADIIQVDKTGELELPKAADVLQIVTKKLQSFPHGLVSLLRLQNMTHNKFDFERIITTQINGYSLNSKLLTWSVLDKADMDEDDHISVREVIKFVLDLLTLLEVNLPSTTLDNIYVYITMLETSVKSLLAKYVITDVAQMDGRVVPDLNNQKFVDQRINIKEVIPNVKITFSGSSFSKYLKSATSVPQKKLTVKSIIEAAFFSSDKNKDYELDLIEFSDLVLVSLPKINSGLQDYIETIKVVKLYDVDHDDQISMPELIEMLKLDTLPRSLIG